MSAPKLERILYVEDEPDIRAVAKLAIEAVGGLGLELCSSGAEAIGRLESGGVPPQLVLLDVMMPDMDGPTTLRRLRGIAGLETLPVMFMTAKIRSSEVAQLKALGAVDVIAKPFDPMTLADDIRARWARAHG
jgi:CheY-like chemotaxis protein